MSSNTDAAKRAKQVRALASKSAGLSDDELDKVVGGMGDNMPKWAAEMLDEWVRTGYMPPGSGSN